MVLVVAACGGAAEAPAVTPTPTVAIAPSPTPAPTVTPRPTIPPREDVTFKSGDLELKGWLWRPAGAGPFPAVLWNHGSSKDGEQTYYPGIWPVFVRAGYVFFVPFRRGQGGSPGTYFDDALRAVPAAQRNAATVKLHETEQLSDQLAGLAFLKTFPYVDTTRIAVTGWSFGGIQTILGAEANPGYRVGFDCAGAALSWNGNPVLRDRLVKAVAKISIPMFLVQAENDATTAPTTTLGAEFARLGKPYKAMIYPAWTAQRSGASAGIPDGHMFCGEGGNVWGPDVTAFIAAALK